MKCGFPITLGNRIVGCGQCMNCRVNKKREWTGRLLLEAASCKTLSSVLTLTYDQVHHPEDGNLKPEHLSEFVDKLRQTPKFTEYVRFFGVGEYGDKSWRPHYHLILFNAHPVKYQDLYRELWGKGHIKVDEMRPGAADYVCGYTTKKLTKSDNLLLEGRNPEFARMSKRPPIGHLKYLEFLDWYGTDSGSAFLARNEDISSVYRINGKIYPLSYTAKKFLRSELGINRPTTSKHEIEWELDYGQVQKQRAQQVKDLYNAKQKHDKIRRQSKSSTYSRRPL